MNAALQRVIQREVVHGHDALTLSDVVVEPRSEEKRSKRMISSLISSYFLLFVYIIYQIYIILLKKKEKQSKDRIEEMRSWPIGISVPVLCHSIRGPSSSDILLEIDPEDFF